MKAKTQGIHHIDLSVPDLNAATLFFIEALGFELVGEKPEYPATFVSDGTVMLSLWRVKDPEKASPFNRHTNIGLHHLALGLASSNELDKLYGEFEKREDVVIEFKPEPLAGSTFRHMMCGIPGNIRLELIAG